MRQGRRLDVSGHRYFMNIMFQKKRGDSSLGIAFFWKIEVETKSPVTITDHFIPELFFDYFFTKEGRIRCLGETHGTKFNLPQQALKTMHTHRWTFVFSTPLVLYGARLSLKFAESFWGEAKANCFLKQEWVRKDTHDLGSFQAQVVTHLESHRTKKLPYPMFSSDLEESAWLSNFSPRHKRRLYQAVFGLSRQELQNIRNIHSFLERTCDFASETPRILRHVSPEVFYDQPHLNHAFKKMTGFAPVEYFHANSILQERKGRAHEIQEIQK
jgi:AraC-like DNA-binding protein